MRNPLQFGPSEQLSRSLKCYLAHYSTSVGPVCPKTQNAAFQIAFHPTQALDGKLPATFLFTTFFPQCIFDMIFQCTFSVDTNIFLYKRKKRRAYVELIIGRSGLILHIWFKSNDMAITACPNMQWFGPIISKNH